MCEKYPHPFSEGELREGYNKCIENVMGLLASAKILCDDENEIIRQYALGLYVYAVEEYGKAILLKRAIKGNKDKYEIDGWILGYGKPKRGNAHNKKMKAALDILPKDCGIIPRGIIVTQASPSKNTVITKKQKHGRIDQVSTAEMTTGTHYDTTKRNIFDYNFDLKTACFYMDWDPKNNSWKYAITIEPQNLMKKITHIEDALAM
ncbi:MAG TPA: AbiV family abortive infection protein [Nitrososphaeraceae archaeon]|nr:AbiV family abortive infection protein [Nitrososphaeraceae archaeon]